MPAAAMSTKEQKPWGKKEILFHDEMTHVERITVDAGSKCSEHHHERKHNLFTVLDGILRIRLKDRDTGEWNSSDLGPGGAIFVPAGRIHQFVGLSQVVAIEIYIPAMGCQLEGDDIVRRAKNPVGFASAHETAAGSTALSGTLKDAERHVADYRERRT